MIDSSFAQVVHKTARELGMRPREVRTIILEFLNQAGSFLMRHESMHLYGLGRFNLRLARDGRVTVSFTKSRRMRLLARLFVKEKEMIDKYGVDEGTSSDILEKAAADGCPECGSKIERHGNVAKCPQCGTKPFESGKRKT